MTDSTNDWLDEILTPTFYKVYMNGFTDQLARHEHGTGHAKSVTDQWIDEAMQAIEAHIKQVEVEARIDELNRLPIIEQTGLTDHVWSRIRALDSTRPLTKEAKGGDDE